jgi:hypothetical protein
VPVPQRPVINAATAMGVETFEDDDVLMSGSRLKADEVFDPYTCEL